MDIRGDLSGRPKNLWGVYRKMCAKGYGLDQVYDVRALRVVVDSKSDCYEVLREVSSAMSTTFTHVQLSIGPAIGSCEIPGPIVVVGAPQHSFQGFLFLCYWLFGALKVVF